MPFRINLSSLGKIPCPMCRELVSSEAKICPHCRSDLTGTSATEPSPEGEPAQQPGPAPDRPTPNPPPAPDNKGASTAGCSTLIIATLLIAATIYKLTA